MAIGRVYPRGSIMHTMSMQSDFSRVVVEKVRDVFVAVLVPTTDVNIEVNTMGEALGTLIAWPTHLIKVISKIYQVYFI